MSTYRPEFDPSLNTGTVIDNFRITLYDGTGRPLPIYPARNLIEPYGRTVFVETPPTPPTPSSFSQNPQPASDPGYFSFSIVPIVPIDFSRTRGYHFQTYFDGTTDFASLNITETENRHGGSRDCITVKDIPTAPPYPYLPYPPYTPSLRCKHFKLRFLPILFTDSDPPSPYSLPSGPAPTDPNLGTIRFVIQEIEHVRPTQYAGVAMNSRPYADRALRQKTVYEKALKGRTLTHTIAASEEFRLTIPTTTLRLRPEVVGQVTMHYRSRGVLQAMGVVPYEEEVDGWGGVGGVPKVEEIMGGWGGGGYGGGGFSQGGPLNLPRGQGLPRQLQIREAPSRTAQEPPPTPRPQVNSSGWFSRVKSMVVGAPRPSKQRLDEYRHLNSNIVKLEQQEIKLERDPDAEKVILAQRSEVPIEEFGRVQALERRRRRARKQFVRQQRIPVIDLTVGED